MKLYEMKCGETCYERSSHSNIIRVPGGWIYQCGSDKTGDVVAQSFVPFNNEFQSASDTTESPSTDAQQLKAEIRASVDRLCSCSPMEIMQAIDIHVAKMRELSAV